MIKAILNHDTIFIGLSNLNLKKLREGFPLYFYEPVLMKQPLLIAFEKTELEFLPKMEQYSALAKEADTRNGVPPTE
jgi:hypothetical protein